jgi:hypothetical protein
MAVGEAVLFFDTALARNVSTILRQPGVEFRLGCPGFSAVD